MRQEVSGWLTPLPAVLRLNWRHLTESSLRRSGNMSFTTHLTELMEQRKAKYLPFYQKIDRPMPESLSNLSEEELCSTMGVKLMSPEELLQFHKEMKEKEDARKLTEAAGLVFRAVLIIGLLALVVCVS